MIFCKSINFLQETEETLKHHVDFINSVFEVQLQRLENAGSLPWFASTDLPNILYMSEHTGDAIRILDYLHFLYTFGLGTQIRDVYLNTCSAKIGDAIYENLSQNQFGIIFPSEATDAEKQKLKLDKKDKFVKLDTILEKIKGDSFKVHLCKQEFVGDEKVKMARFLPMDECGLGFSPTSSELLLYNHKGSLSEKLKEAFDEIA